MFLEFWIEPTLSISITSDVNNVTLRSLWSLYFLFYVFIQSISFAIYAMKNGLFLNLIVKPYYLI